MYSLHYVLTVLLFASNSFQVWKNRKPSQLKCGGTKACDWFGVVFLTGRERVEHQILLREDNVKLLRKAKIT